MDEFSEFLEAMRFAGAKMRFERPDFNFGEWAGESTSEIIFAETGREEHSFAEYERDDLLNAYLGS